MAFTISDVFDPADAAEWFQTLIDNAGLLGLTATAWQIGSVARTILAISSYALQFTDVQVSLIAQGGFLDFAAEGSITYTDAAGQKVTVPVTPEGGPGWLDILASSRYNIERIQATYAGGTLAITNTSVTTYNVTAGTYHVSNPYTKQSYTNTAAISIVPSSTIASVALVVDFSGLIEIATSAPHGLSTGAVVSLVGVGGIPPLASPTAWTITVLDATHFTLDNSTFTGTYTSGGTVYEPTLATVTADVLGTVANSTDALGVPNVNTVTQPVTSLVGVSVGNPIVYLGSDVETNRELGNRCRMKLQSLSPNGPKGAYEFFAKSAQTYAPLLGPPKTVGTAITRVRTIQYPPSGTVYVFIANAAGAPSAQDVSATDAVLQAYSTPNAVSCETVGATNKNVEIVTNAWVPNAYNNSLTQQLFQLAIQNEIKALPIGGVSDPQGSYTDILPYEATVGAVFEAAEEARIPLQEVSLTINGASQDLQLVVDTGLLVAEVAVLVPAVPQMNLVSV